MTEDRDARTQVEAGTEKDLELKDLELKDLELKNVDAADVRGGACTTGTHIPAVILHST